jgi:hypothetical protein
MAKKNLWLGMLVTVLVFVMTVVGCATTTTTTFYIGGDETFSDDTVWILDGVRNSQLTEIHPYGTRKTTHDPYGTVNWKEEYFDESVIYPEVNRIVTDYTSIRPGIYYAVKSDSGKVFVFIRNEKSETVTTSSSTDVDYVNRRGETVGTGAVGQSVSQDNVYYSHSVYEFSGKIPEDAPILK